jgi:hypothetical protein
MMTPNPEHHDQGKHFEIFINGRKKEVSASTLTYQDLVNLAFDNNPPSGPNVVITVTYSRGEHDSSGSLIAGQQVIIKSGMVFNVKATDRS